MILRRYFLAGALFATIFALVPGLAQEARDAGSTSAPASTAGDPHPGLAPREDSRPSNRPNAAPGSTDGSRHLPPDSITKHELSLPGHTLRFTATAGSIRLTDREGKPEADIAYVAYMLDGADTRSRPITFALNGGPGAASAWLDLGAIGPWRLPMAGASIAPSAPPVVQENAETWLDFTDLVFIDPAGTGYSRVLGGDDVRRRLYSVEGDVDSIAEVMRRWLAKNNRLVSPKFIVGESYGGFRGPRLARTLVAQQGVAVEGLMLISPVLDFAWWGTRDSMAISFAKLLPSYAAAALEMKGTLSRAALADVEQYSQGEYLRDFMAGLRDQRAVERMSEQVAALTGLDPTLVKRLAGRVDTETFRHEFDHSHGRITSPYDATVSALDPFPTSEDGRRLDPFLEGFAATLSTAMIDVYNRNLEWRVDDRYEILNQQVNRSWEWGRGLSQPQSVTALREALALDPRLRVTIVHGLTDLVTPYFGSKMILDQIPDFGAPDRLKLVVLGGGHMMYSRDQSRRELREDALSLIGHQ